jgi:hypothetical protein
MASFLDNLQKENIKNIIDSIHDTFSRPITVYKLGKKTTLSSSTSYNSLYKTKGNQLPNSEVIQVSKVINARIKYVKIDQEYFYQESSQEKIIIPQGSVLIKVNYEDYMYIKDAKTVELDTKTYKISSPGKPEGMFGPQYYQFLLIPLES